MKIAMLIARFPPTVGGAEIQCFRLSTWLAREGHEVIVLTERSAPGQPRQERVNGFEVVRFKTCGCPPWSSLFYGLKTFFYLLTHPGFDLYHAHMISTPALTACLAGLFTRTPILVKVAGARNTGDFSTSRRSWRGGLKLRLFKKGNPFVVCPSRETYEEAQSFGVPENKLFCIPNGVDTAFFCPSSIPKNQQRASLLWPADALIAIYVGRWAKGKGVETLLDVWEEGASHSGFPWHLALLLSEPAPEAIARRLERLEEHVHVVIGATDTTRYYQAADLAVLLSEGEGLSNFLLEAMACGLPSLTTAAAALPDADGEKTGAHTLASNAQTAKEALSYLLETARQPARLTSMGNASRRHIEKNYSLDQTGRSYLSLYAKMLD